MGDPSFRVVVVGSLNVDHTLTVERIPAPGETVGARGALTSFGGKGANQAVAAARASPVGGGGEVCLIGCVGGDVSGAAYLTYLEGEDVDASRVAISDDVPTGSAFIVVNAVGENTIVVDPGANHAVDAAAIEAQRTTITAASVLLMQLECPLATVRRAAQLARSAGVTIVVNPSPWDDAFLAAGVPCDVLIVNEGEAAALGGEEGLLDSVFARGSGLHTLVVTRGPHPTRVYSREAGLLEVAPPDVAPLDTVGAGDSFAGAFTVALAEGRTMREAVPFANTAGALATLKMGAQAAVPRRTEIERFLSGNVPP